VSAEKSEIRKEQHERERQWKNTGKETRDNLKDVNQRSAESEIRKEQNDRESQWKNTGKETRDNLKDVNIGVSAKARLQAAT
jgi:hypothetical protein